MKSDKDIKAVIEMVGKFPPDAFQFVQEGLSFAVQDAHGEMNEPQRMIHEFMYKNDLDLDQLEDLMANEELPDGLRELIEDAGGIDELNRHVSGQNLCWGLRDYALQRWGALAGSVLFHWNIRQTRDFGEIVFALVENDFLQKQPNDSIEDFENVYQFREAFEGGFNIQLDRN
jgi:uncharacterized repeat protein (TIGR04138 family)